MNILNDISDIELVLLLKQWLKETKETTLLSSRNCKKVEWVIELIKEMAN